MLRYWRELWMVGVRSAWANRLPMVVLWVCAIALSVSYLYVPDVATCLEPIRRWQVACGWSAAALSAAFFCGIVPGIFQIAVRSLRPPRPFCVIAAQVAVSAVNGILCWNFYKLQALWFGTDVSVGTLAVKTAVDQFVWTPLAIAPLNAVCYFVIARDFSRERVRREWPSSFFFGVLLPYLVPMWCVNVIPNFALYAFPPALQTQLIGLLCSFWTLMCFQVALRSR